MGQFFSTVKEMKFEKRIVMITIDQEKIKAMAKTLELRATQ